MTTYFDFDSFTAQPFFVELQNHEPSLRSDDGSLRILASALSLNEIRGLILAARRFYIDGMMNDSLDSDERRATVVFLSRMLSRVAGRPRRRAGHLPALSLDKVPAPPSEMNIHPVAA